MSKKIMLNASSWIKVMDVTKDLVQRIENSVPTSGPSDRTCRIHVRSEHGRGSFLINRIECRFEPCCSSGERACLALFLYGISVSQRPRTYVCAVLMVATVHVSSTRKESSPVTRSLLPWPPLARLKAHLVFAI
jgi:hypothetical protein